MEMVLLDWTRMGRSYCVAGAVAQGGGWRVVRPLLAKLRSPSGPPPGWSAYLLDGHARWDVFELIAPEPASAQPPHLEDLWVRALRPCGRSVVPELRRAILQATAPRDGKPLFGAPLAHTRTAAYLQPGCGERSLATIVVGQRSLRFHGSQRVGSAGPDFRVELPLPQVGNRHLPIKDHHLLMRVEPAPSTIDGQLHALEQAVRGMGDPLALRLGLSRPFAAAADGTQAFCWLMADGFFSLADPRP